MNATNVPQSTPRPKLKWYQFSVSGLLLFTFVLALLLGILMIPARRQASAVGAARKLGGIVTIERSKWKWLDSEGGRDFFGTVTAMDFATDWATRSVSNTSRIGDDDLRLLEALSSIKTLDLGNNPKLTDQGLVHLRGLVHLEKLSVHRTGITGPGLSNVAALPNLTELMCNMTPLTDKGLVHIGKMTNLRYLFLDNTKITDEGLRHVSGLRSLQHLTLHETEITDAGLEHLAGLSRLKKLSLYFTRGVSLRGLDKLKKALPACQISSFLPNSPR